MAGILARLKNHLTPLVSRDVFLALSGEEVHRTLNPLISTVLKTLMRLMSKPGQYPCVFCIDELISLYIPGLTDFPSTGRSGSVGWLGTTRSQRSVSDQVDLRHPRIGDTTDVKGLSPGCFYSIRPRKRYRQGPERAQAYPMIGGAHDFDISPLHILGEVEAAYQTILREAEGLIERRERR